MSTGMLSVSAFERATRVRSNSSVSLSLVNSDTCVRLNSTSKIYRWRLCGPSMRGETSASMGRTRRMSGGRLGTSSTTGAVEIVEGRVPRSSRWTTLSTSRRPICLKPRQRQRSVGALISSRPNTAGSLRTNISSVVVIGRLLMPSASQNLVFDVSCQTRVPFSESLCWIKGTKP